MERRHAHIDWSGVRERLARASARADDVETRRRILADRARRLAVPIQTSPHVATPAIAFDADGERYALLTSGVARIERVTAIVRLPASPAFLLGMVPLRNRACPILHLPSLLGRPGEPAQPPRWALLLGTADERLALGADEVALVDIVLETLHPAAGDRERVRYGWTDDARTVLDASRLVDHATRRLRGKDA